MKKLIFIFAGLLALAACQEKSHQGIASTSDADSIYTYQYISMHFVKEPERCLGLIDTAEMKGTMTADSCNMMRGYVYYSGICDREQGKHYMRLVLDRKGLEHSSDVYISTLAAYCSLCLSQENGEEALNAALEGIKLTHKRNLPIQKASFYATAGYAMKNKRPDTGEMYIRKAIGIIRSLDELRAQPKASYYMSLLAMKLSARGNNDEAAKVCRERLDFIDEMEQKGIRMPAGYYDKQRGGAYCVLAFCELELGHKAEARRAVENFEKTLYAATPSGLFNILPYYVKTGNKNRVEQISELQEKYLEQQGDTINSLYRTLFINKANLYKNLGDYRRAFEATTRASIIQDSLEARERNSKAEEYEVRFKTQEAEMALKEKEAQGRIHLILIIALATILVLGGLALWRIIKDKRRLNERNRDLYKTIQQMLDKEKEAEQTLEETPTTALSASQQLYQSIVKLMKEQKPYTSSNMNRDSLAQMMNTNYNLLANAIRECANGQSIGDFIEDWRLRHAAQLLAETDKSIGLVMEESGFASRSHFNTLFRERFKMTPSEYRKVTNG
jgi:AraC-like DNA-binding protein